MSPDRGTYLLDEARSLSDAEIRDLGPGDLDAVRSALNSNLFFFAQTVFGYRDLIPSLHGDLANWIALWGYCEVDRGRGPELVFFDQVSTSDTVLADYRRIMTQIPREFFKTSVGTRANALWQICRHPHLPVAIFNERQDNAKKWVRAIREVIEGSRIFQDVYRDLLPPGVHYEDQRSMPRSWKWTDTEIDLDGKNLGEAEASISAHGVEGATTGGHWPKMILDDLISVKHKLSEVEMDRAREWVSNHVYLMRPAERSMSYVNCTPWTYTDIYRDLLRDHGYKLYRRSALEDPRSGVSDVATGESIFPQKLSTVQLRHMYGRDPYSFKAQMQCQPSVGRESGFDTDWIHPGRVVIDELTDEPTYVIPPEHFAPGAVGSYNPDRESAPRTIPLHLMRKEIILDPAPSEDSEKRRDPHARSALFCEGIDPWGRRFILETKAVRDAYPEVIKHLFEMATRWGVRLAHVEEVNFSNVYRHWVYREQEPDGRWPGFGLSVRPLKPNRRDKDSRILARQVDWRNGLYHVNAPDCGQFLVEFSEYPNSETKDLMDCMGYDKDPGVLSRPETPYEQALSEWNSTPRPHPYGGRDPQTGYSITMRTAP